MTARQLRNVELMKIILWAIEHEFDFDVYDDLRKTYNDALSFLKEKGVPTPTGYIPEI